MTKLLLFGEFIDSNNLNTLFQQKLNILTSLNGLGTYFQGIAQQNTVDFIWGTDSGTRNLPIALFLSFFRFIFADNWYNLYEVLSIILPFFGFLLAIRLIKKTDAFVLIGSFIYAFNPWVFSRLFSGFWQLHIAYALLPFIITIPLLIEQKQNIQYKTILYWSSIYALLASIIFSSQPHFLLIAALFLIMHLGKTAYSAKKTCLALLLFYGVSILFFLFLNSYIILPSILYPEKLFTAPNQYFSIGSVRFNGTGSTIENVLRLSPLVFPFTPIKWEINDYLELIPIFLTLIIFVTAKPKNWLFIFNLFVLIFLAKGLNPPFENISEFLYRYISPLHFFRDPPRLIAGIALFGSLIIASNISKKKTKFLILVVTLLYILLSWNTVFRKQSKEIIQYTSIPSEYTTMEQTINHLPTSQQRIMTIPNSHGLSGYPFYTNKTSPSSNTIWDLGIPLNIPLANSSNYPDNYSSQFSAYAYHYFTNTYNESILQPLGVKYLLLDENIIKPQQEKDIATSSAVKFTQNPNLRKLKQIKKLSLWEIKKDNPLVTNEKPIFTIGDFSTITKLKQQSNRPVILLNQELNSQLLISSLLKKQDIFIDTPDANRILTAESLTNKYAIDLLTPVWDYDKSFANCEPYKMNFIENTGTLFTSGRCIQSSILHTTVNIKIKTTPGKYKILIKLLTILPNTPLQIKVANKNINQVLTTKEKLQWLDLGSVVIADPQTTIQLTSDGARSLIIDHLLLVPESIYQQKSQTVAAILKSMNNVSLKDLTSPQTDTKYTQAIDKISLKAPTKYLTYHFTWGQQWKSNQPSVKYISDGYGMTYITTQKNLTSITYPPNNPYKSLLVISGITYCLLIVFNIGYFVSFIASTTH